MCGIAGAVWFDAGAVLEPDVVARMAAVLVHRGPDGSGSYRREFAGLNAPGAALAHRRLSIIDLEGGKQPLANEDGTIWTVFNGEIYNHRELQSLLEARGHRFATRSDTEVLVHLYEEYGVDFVDHLTGMFALAIWDAKEGRLVLARDRLGKKPLYYRLESARLSFASELKSLLEVPGVVRQIDPDALDAYLTYNYVPYPRTIFRGIAKLPPGYRAVYAAGRLRTDSYWNPDFSSEERRSLDDDVEALREKFTEAVRIRLEADVPLGAFLSGGVDSSLVVALMQRLGSGPVKTFSIGFSEPQYDETPKARRVAEHLKTEHHEFRVEPECLEVLEKLVWHFDEPFADSSAIPTYYVAKLSREFVTVALTGDGGDELFAGYDRYRAVQAAAWLDHCPRWVRTSIRRLCSGLAAGNASRSLLHRAGRFGEAVAYPPAQRYLQWVALFNEARRASLYRPDFQAQLSGDSLEFLMAALDRYSNRDPVTAASLADLTTYLPCDLMTKVDITSMANSLECRAPFLDHRLVEWAFRLPIDRKLRGAQRKWILQRAFGDLLPSWLFHQRKMGFGVPLAQWFRRDLANFSREVLLDSAAAVREYFRPEAMKQLLDEHQSGADDHSPRLWGLLFFELWHRQWMGPVRAASSRSEAVQT